MAKIVRKNMKIFGTNSGFHQVGVFGSLAAGSPAYTTDPETIQSLSNYLTGWYAAVVGANSPAIQDMNALCFLFAYQLAYQMQTGVPEWNSLTTYFIGSFVSSGNVIYVSLTDNNLNNTIPNATHWRIYQPKNTVRTTTANDTATSNDDYIRADPTGGSFTETLPTLASVADGFALRIKNVATNGNTVTVKGNGAELIDQANTFVLDSTPSNDCLTVIKTATKWDII